MGLVGDCAVVPATGRVTLPVHVVWSAQGDLGVQFGAWDDLRLALHVRAQWGI